MTTKQDKVDELIKLYGFEVRIRNFSVGMEEITVLAEEDLKAANLRILQDDEVAVPREGFARLLKGLKVMADDLEVMANHESIKGD